LEDENRRLKTMVADLSSDKEALNVALVRPSTGTASARLASCWTWSARAIDIERDRTARWTCGSNWLPWRGESRDFDTGGCGIKSTKAVRLYRKEHLSVRRSARKDFISDAWQ
jgi:hypothetical protein